MSGFVIFLLYGFICMAVPFCLHRLISRPLCSECGAKAAPHVTRALIRANHDREKAEEQSRRWYLAATPYATPSALREALIQLQATERSSV